MKKNNNIYYFILFITIIFTIIYIYHINKNIEYFETHSFRDYNNTNNYIGYTNYDTINNDNIINTQKKYIYRTHIHNIPINDIIDNDIKINKNKKYNKLYNTSTDYGNTSINYTVNLPLTDTYTCNNMCSSQSKCYLTGEQCSSDADCYGCKKLNKIPTYKYNKVKGLNDAGKYKYYTPQYSPLTTDIGTQAKLYGKKLAKVPQMYWGLDLWSKYFDIGTKMDKSNSSYIWDPTLQQQRYTPNYPVRQTTTGLFYDYGPLASNAYL